MNKVHCLKAILSKLTQKNPSEFECDTVCECLDEMAKAVPTLGQEVVGAKVNFTRKTIMDGNVVLLGYDGNVNMFLTLANGQDVPVTVTFTDAA